MIAPTGTIGLVMDCDTTGIEPDFALVKFKKLAGGGYFKIINQAVPEALRTLGYGEAEIAEIEAYAVGHGTLAQAPAINHGTLKAKGFTDEALRKLDGALEDAPSTSSSCSTSWTLGEEFLTETLKIPAETAQRPGVRPARPPRLLQEGHRGRQRARVRGDDAGRRAAPRAESTCRCSIAPTPAAARASATCRSTSHIHMMAASQPFISGAISKTINMPNEATRGGLQGSPTCCPGGWR